MDGASELCGYVALVATTLGLCLRSDRLLRVLNLAGVGLWMAHLGLLGAWTAFGMMALAMVMIGSALLWWDRVSKAALLVNVALLPVAVGLVLGADAAPAMLSPIMGGLLINIGVSRCRGHTMTGMIAAGEACWVVTGLLVGSVPVVAANLLNLSALGVRTLWVLWAARRKGVASQPG